MLCFRDLKKTFISWWGTACWRQLSSPTWDPSFPVTETSCWTSGWQRSDRLTRWCSLPRLSLIFSDLHLLFSRSRLWKSPALLRSALLPSSPNPPPWETGTFRACPQTPSPLRTGSSSPVETGQHAPPLRCKPFQEIHTLTVRMFLVLLLKMSVNHWPSRSSSEVDQKYGSREGQSLRKKQNPF